MRKKTFLIFFLIIFLVFLIQILFQNKKILNIKIEKVLNKEVLKYNNKKKYLVECKLFNEIIDRKKIDNERECYYLCSE